MFFLLCVSRAEEAGGRGAVCVPPRGTSVAGWGWPARIGGKEVVQGVLEGGDDVCTCKDGLKWCGEILAVGTNSCDQNREMALRW